MAVLLGTGLLWNASAHAKDYTRSCSAAITIGATTPDGRRLQGTSYNFSGRGTVGYFTPNKARERARRNIDAARARRYRAAAAPRASFPIFERPLTAGPCRGRSIPTCTPLYTDPHLKRKDEVA
jgi:hypothetical protein